jgi:MFS family permease
MMTSKRPRVFYGWWIVVVSAIGLFLGAPLVIFSFSVFFKPLVVNFHASRAAVSFAFSLQNTVGALWIPLSGVLIDRLGAKRVIIWMTLFYGLILITALWVGNSIWQLYLFFSILGIALSSGPVPVPYGAVISHWFNRHRGLALGLAMLGVLLMGEGYDRFHSYTVPLAGFCAVMLLALLLLSRLGPYRYGVTREASPPLEPVQVSSGA